MITFGEVLNKEKEEYDKLTDEEVLQRLIKHIYRYYNKYGNGCFTTSKEYDLKPTDETLDYHKYITEYLIDDYALNDMVEFLEKYPYMQCISFGILHEMQEKCNADGLDAGWCGCFEPRYMLYILERG